MAPDFEEAAEAEAEAEDPAETDALLLPAEPVAPPTLLDMKAVMLALELDTLAALVALAPEARDAMPLPTDV